MTVKTPYRRAFGALPRRAVILAFLILFGLGVQLALAGLGFNGALQGQLADPDAYMRLFRSIDLWRGGPWYEPIAVQTNVPYGEHFHWTRSLDIVLLALAAPLVPFFGFERALFAAGWALGPFCALGCLVALAWGTRRYLSDRTFILLGVFFALQTGAINMLALARPDHHALLLLLYVVQLAGWLRFAAEDSSDRSLIWAGAAGGLALWTGVESQVTSGSLIAAPILLWIGGADRFGPALARYGIGLALAAGLGLILEHSPAAWMNVEYDRYSFVHWILATGFAAFWILVGRLRPIRSGPARVGIALLGCAIPIGAALAVAPKFLDGPIAEVPPWVAQFFLDHIGEARPILPYGDSSIFFALQRLALPLIALAFCPILLRDPETRHRRLAIFVIVGVLPLGFASLVMDRWSGFIQCLALLPFVLALRRAWYGAGYAGRIPLRAPVLAALLTLPLLAPLPFAPSAAKALVRAPAPCDWAAMRRSLIEMSLPPSRIVTQIFDGPVLIWDTPHGVVGSPYHRNGEGMYDTLAFFGAIDEETARGIARKRGLDLALLCRSTPEIDLLENAGREDRLFERLADDRPPAWMIPVALPDAGLGQFRLYRIEGSR